MVLKSLEKNEGHPCLFIFKSCIYFLFFPAAYTLSLPFVIHTHTQLYKDDPCWHAPVSL